MSLLIGLLSLILVVSSVLLCLLILVQLPKKEAGMGAAFGADQAAALFGAGSGTALTSITKWLASIFLILCLIISILTAYDSRSTAARIRAAQQDAPAAASPALPSTPATTAPGPTAPGPSGPSATFDGGPEGGVSADSIPLQIAPEGAPALDLSGESVIPSESVESEGSGERPE